MKWIQNYENNILRHKIIVRYEQLVIDMPIQQEVFSKKLFLILLRNSLVKDAYTKYIYQWIAHTGECFLFHAGSKVDWQKFNVCKKSLLPIPTNKVVYANV